MHTTLLIVDTTAAPALHICCRSIVLLVFVHFETYRFIMKIFTHVPYTVREIKTGNTRFHALIQFDLHSFDQNILSSQEGGGGGVFSA